VTISDSTSGATIYYTTNGTTPTTGSSVYSGAITVSATETLEAIATQSGYTTSAVGSAAYTISGTTEATIDWASVYQIIDGFGASDAFSTVPLTSAQQGFFFGTGTGQLGLSILRTGVPNNEAMSGNCATVNSGCAGPYVSDMQAAIADGAKIYSSPWTPPAIYKSNGSPDCTNSSDGLIPADYALYATWLANYVQSLKTYDGITLYALSVQNEPETCQSYDSAIWTAANLDTFVASNLGPAFSSAGLSTLIFLPESANYMDINLGASCAGDSSCNKYVGGVNWHDYDASLSGTNTVAQDNYPSTWPAGKKYWETEASCGSGFGPNFCKSGFNADITDALNWAAVIDQRLAVDGANAWLYWWLIDTNSTDDQGLEASNGTIAARAYMLGQYSKFVRPGYYRISATHLPQIGVSISAYQDTATDTMVIIATNYSNSAVSQTFTMANAPSFSSATPTTTSASMKLAQQANVSVSSNAFTYTLPAQSITTFVIN
jgi:glucuronoarabinoxylan endo-1,4-beta-xylanase